MFEPKGNKKTEKKEEDLSPKIVTADAIREAFAGPFDEFKQKATEEDQLKLIEENRPSTNWLIAAIRLIKNNPDIILYGCGGITLICLGYCLAFVRMAFSVKEIQVGITDFFAILFFFVTSTGTFLLKLYNTKPGTIATAFHQSFQSKVNAFSARASKKEVTLWGVSLEQKHEKK